MAVDERLATRVRAILRNVPGVEERRMFGGLAFMVDGHMACGVLGTDLVLRLGEQGATAALERPHVRPMDFTGRPIRSMVFVAPAGVDSARALRRWVDRAINHAQTLPPKH